jgi:two-component system nitrogen regulation response regulator NtrX
MAQILVVDDEIGIRELLSEILSDEGHTVKVAENATQAREARQRARPDLVLLDIWMPDADGITLLKEWASSGQLNMPVVMMSGHATIDTAVEATRIGALDFLEKPIALQKLLATVKRALAQQDVRASRAISIGDFGKSRALADLKKRLAQLAPARSWVLLRGERGVMPELYARALHQPGTAWINAGSFLGKAGTQEAHPATGGVLFIDELGRLSPNQQKHLGFLAGQPERFKLRVVSFSSQGLRRLSESQGLDAGLATRLSEVVLPIPPLRELVDDIPDLAQAFLGRLIESRDCPPRRFSPEALRALCGHDWPGNLEDLAGAVRSLAATALGEEITAAEAAATLREFAGEGPLAELPLDMPLREAREAFERAYFERHLAAEGGSIARVAEKSGLERTHLYRKLKALGIPTGRKDGDS